MQYIDCIFAKKMLFISFTEAYIAQDTEDPYFFGTIIIDCSQDGYLNLIYGQQRTTTFWRFYTVQM